MSSMSVKLTSSLLLVTVPPNLGPLSSVEPIILTGFHASRHSWTLTEFRIAAIPCNFT